MNSLQFVGRALPVLLLVLVPIIIVYFGTAFAFAEAINLSRVLPGILIGVAPGVVPLALIVAYSAQINPTQDRWLMVFFFFGWIPVAFWTIYAVIYMQISDDPNADFTIYWGLMAVPAALLVAGVGALYERLRHSKILGKYLP